MGSALTGLLIFLGLQLTFVGVLLGMARWERLAEPQRVEEQEGEPAREASAARDMASSEADVA
jgi:hypothetical protein